MKEEKVRISKIEREIKKDLMKIAKSYHNLSNNLHDVETGDYRIILQITKKATKR